jgi:hypothetical protein
MEESGFGLSLSSYLGIVLTLQGEFLRKEKVFILVKKSKNWE